MPLAPPVTSAVLPSKLISTGLAPGEAQSARRDDVALDFGGAAHDRARRGGDDGVLDAAAEGGESIQWREGAAEPGEVPGDFTEALERLSHEELRDGSFHVG